MYGNSAAYMTMNRAAYGDVNAAIMGGGGAYGPEDPAMHSSMLSQVGATIRPVTYTAPARVNVTYSGMVTQPTGFFSGMGAFMGIQDPSRSQMASSHIYNTASDFGERVGGGIMTGAMAAGGIALGAAASPIARAAATGLAGGGMLGGAAGFLAGTFAAPMAGMAIAQGVTTAMVERREMQGFLEAGSYRFAGAGSSMADSRTGGMSRSARQDFTEFARGMDVSDKFMDMGDLQSVLEQGTARGLFNGSGGDMESFKSKFKEITDAVKVVTRTLGQTLEEGMKTLQELKSIGIDPSQASAVVGQADAMGRVAGKTAAEMLDIGVQGANLFRGTGVSMQVGAQANMMNLASVRAARDSKALSEEAIMQAGGEEAMAQRMTASGLAFAQTGMGRGMTAAFVQGGAFNSQSFMNNAMAGGGDIRDLGMQAARNMASPADLIAMQANQEQIVSDMGAMFGGQGLQVAQMNSAMAQASMISGATGASMQDAFKASLRSQGLSSQEVDARMAMMNNAGGNFRALQSGAGQTRNNAVIEEASRNFIGNRMMSAAGDIVNTGLDYLARPANRAIDSIAEGFVSFKEEQLYGIQRASMRGVDGSTPTFLTTADLENEAAGVNLDKGGILSRTIGEKLTEAISSGAFDAAGVTKESITGTIGTAGGRDLINKRFQEGGVNLGVVDGARAVIGKDTLSELKQYTANSQITHNQASAMKERGALKDVKLPNIGAMIASGNFDNVQSVDQLVEEVYGMGKNQGNISSAEYAALVDTFQGSSLQGVLDKARSAGATVQEANRATGVLAMQRSRERYEGGLESLSDAFGGSIGKGVAAKLAAARAADRQGKGGVASKMIDEATLQLAQESGASMEDVKGFVQQVQSGGLDASLKDINQGRAGMMAAQNQIGKDELSSAIVGQLSAKSMDDVSEGVKDKIRGVALKISRPGGLDNLSGDEISTLSKAGGLGKALGSRLESLQRLGTGSVDSMDRKDLRTTLEQNLGEKRATQIIARMDRGEQLDFSQIASEARSSLARDLAGDDFATAATEGSAEKGKASAAQLFQTQTSINLQTLSAMEALAKRLGR